MTLNIDYLRDLWLCIEYEFCRLVTTLKELIQNPPLCIEYEFCRLVTGIDVHPNLLWLCIEYEFCRLVTSRLNRVLKFICCVLNTNFVDW